MPYHSCLSANRQVGQKPKVGRPKRDRAKVKAGRKAARGR